MSGHGELSPELEDLGLSSHVAELATSGLCVVPPEVTGASAQWVRSMSELVLRRTTAFIGCGFTVERGPDAALEYHPDAEPVNIVVRTGNRPNQVVVQQLAGYHRAFRDLAVHPAAVALARHLIGEARTRFSNHQCFVKWRDEYGYGSTLGLHADQTAVPQPWGQTAFVANATWCLTDYTRAGGALAYVPGSHRRDGRPDGAKAAREAVPVEAEAGSLIVFHGATWHGAYPRTVPGLRLSVTNLYRHVMVTAQEDLRHSLDRRLADDCRNPELFRELAGFNDGFPYVTQRRPVRVVSSRS